MILNIETNPYKKAEFVLTAMHVLIFQFDPEPYSTNLLKHLFSMIAGLLFEAGSFGLHCMLVQ
jgi:hypothetical protein